MSTQLNWRSCHKCQGLYYGGFPTAGTCPADHGQHDPAGSFYYELPFDEPPREYLQQLWKACHKCLGLYYAGFPTAGRCPADGGQHSPEGSFAYALRYAEGPTSHYQDAWRACNKCQGLFYGGHAPGGAFRPNGGVCPAGGDHLGPASFIYGLEFKTTGPVAPAPPALHLSIDNGSGFAMGPVVWQIWRYVAGGIVLMPGSLSGNSASFNPPGTGNYIVIPEVTASGYLADFRGDATAPSGQSGLLIVWTGADLSKKFRLMNESGNPVVILVE